MSIYLTQRARLCSHTSSSSYQDRYNQASTLSPLALSQTSPYRPSQTHSRPLWCIHLYFLDPTSTLCLGVERNNKLLVSLCFLSPGSYSHGLHMVCSCSLFHSFGVASKPWITLSQHGTGTSYLSEVAMAIVLTFTFEIAWRHPFAQIWCTCSSCDSRS